MNWLVVVLPLGLASCVNGWIEPPPAPLPRSWGPIQPDIIVPPPPPVIYQEPPEEQPPPKRKRYRPRSKPADLSKETKAEPERPLRLHRLKTDSGGRPIKRDPNDYNPHFE